MAPDKAAIYDKIWRKLRIIRLKMEPFCRICKKMGKLTRATTVDHVIPIRQWPEGRLVLNNTQSLCKPCHDSIKQRMENGSVSPVGVDGFPIATDHPWNKE
jgi:5-methylcytosine-specific restriction endonuclease McrA